MNRGIKHLKRITRRIVKKSFSSDIKSKHGTVYVHVSQGLIVLVTVVKSVCVTCVYSTPRNAILLYCLLYIICLSCLTNRDESILRGVDNDLKFHRSPLKLFLKDEILPEICAV